MSENVEMKHEPAAEKTDDVIKVLLVEPEQYPRKVEISPGLESLQKAVGGDIEAVYPYSDNVALVMNESGKIDGLPLNRALRDDEGQIYDAVAGSFLVVGLGEEDFSSLTDQQMEKYEKLFHQPEAFLRVNRKLMVIPIPDESLPQNSKAKAAVDQIDRAVKAINSEAR